MKSISIIIPEHAVVSSITDAKRLFRFANQFLYESTGKDFFDVQLVGFTPEIRLDEGTVTIRADKTLQEVTYTDLIIVPALAGDVLRGTQFNRHYFPWLTEHYKAGAEIASFCIGAFIVAATGLLNGKKCATHWMYTNELSVYYPDVEIIYENVITEQNRIYSSGGGTSYWNLLLYLLEKYTSREVVIAAAKYFLLDIERTSQAPFVTFKGLKKHGDELVERVQIFIEANYKGKFNIKNMADDFAIVRRTLERRFKKATKNSIVEYIQRIKIEAAKKEIETGRKNINEIMYDLDYSDKKAFKELFARITGLTPNEYKKKYAGER